MPRSARAIVAGGCYHVLNRGNNRSTVFHATADYAGFVDLLTAAQQRISLDLFAVCLMPNHFHLVVRAANRDDISRWMHWLLTTHAHRFHMHRGSIGRVWQGRFKAFPIEQDTHLLTVMRYVERNALRAGLVERAQDWEWGSLAWRFGGTCDELLAEPPVARPSNWADYVNSAQTAAELDAIRLSVNRQRPFGSDAWVRHAAPGLGLMGSIRRPGRPRKPAATLPLSSWESS
jgi:putative transposase